MDAVLLTSDMFSSALCIFAVLIALFYFNYRRTYSFWSSRGIRGPTPLPFFGNTLALLTRTYPEVDQENWRKFGRVYGVYEGSTPVLVISDPDVIREIYTTRFADFSDQIEVNSADPIDTQNVLVQGGEAWKRVRSIITSVFSTSCMKQIFDDMKMGRQGYLELIESHAQADREIVPRDLYTLIVLDAACRSLFALNIDAYKNAQSRFVESAKGVLAFSTLQFFMMNNFPDWITKFLNLGMMAAGETSYLKNFMAHVVKERESSAMKRKDFLQVLMDSKEENASLKGKGLEEIEVTANSVLFVAVAFDTTTTTITTLSWLMALHPDKQEKIYDEIVKVLGTDLTNELTYEDMSKLVYLEAAINETLRMYSVDQRGWRRSVVDNATIPGTDVTIPKGTHINLAYYALHHDPEIFDEPHVFRPERFLPENKDSLKSYSFMSFGAGPRKCPGVRFAMVNIKLALVEILRRYRIVRSANTRDTVKMTVGRMMFVEDDIRLKMVPRM